MQTLDVLGISGSLREKSYNTALLREASRLAPAGMSIEIASIRDIPLYDADLEARGFPAGCRCNCASGLPRADALLIATPEYNFSIPGVLKNAIDWLSRPPHDARLKGKPVAIVGAGGRLGSARAQYHLRQVCGCLSMLPVPRPEVFIAERMGEVRRRPGRLIKPRSSRSRSCSRRSPNGHCCCGGRHMIDLYYWPTSNGRKITIMLHEVELPYNIIPVNFKIGEQYAPEFLRDQSEQQDPGDRRPRSDRRRRADRDVRVGRDPDLSRREERQAEVVRD